MATKRFLIIGQARSGTTLVQTLLNSSDRMLCRGELFDNWQIDDNGAKIQDIDQVRARDADPAAFLDRFLSAQDLPKAPEWVGAKILSHHNTRLFQEVIPNHPEWAIVYVTRSNKLAQFSSHLQVKATGEWTRTQGKPTPPKVQCDPRWASSETNRLANEDFLLGAWLETLANPILKLDYDRLLERETRARLIGFFGLSRFTRLRSPLIKQGQDEIAARFENRQDIETHFRALGREAWLGTELS